MPELPEVETIRRDLEKVLLNDHVVEVSVSDRRLMSSKEEARWQKEVFDRRWKALGRKGKYLWVELEGGWRLVFHLRMTGQLILGEGKSRLRLVFASGHVLSFCDQRRFGEAWLLAPGEPWPSRTDLGPDALNELGRDSFVSLIRTRPTRIQPLLMDQSRIAGVGNIYAQEALFKAQIRPTRSSRRLSREEASRLYDALHETLETAIVYRGSTSRNYLDANGKHGSAQTLHAVYQRGGKPCLRCQSPLKRVRVGGRGSVFCPQCQR